MMILKGAYTGDRSMQYAWPVPPVVTLAKVEGTKYWKFHETMAMARGPRGYRVLMEDFNYHVWIAYVYGTYIAIERYDGENWVDYTLITPALPAKPTHVSLTFDNIGNPVCAYELEGIVYLRWYDAVNQVVTITTIGEGKSPFVSLEFFNSFIGISQIQMVYVKPDKSVVTLYQDDRYLVEYPTSLPVVDDILSFGCTAFSNLKIVYTAKEGATQVIANRATPRKGLWAGQAVKQEFEVTDFSVSISDAIKISPDSLDSPFFGDVTSIGIEIVSASIELKNVNKTAGFYADPPVNPDGATLGISVGTVVIECKNSVINKGFSEVIPSPNNNFLSDLIINTTVTAIPVTQSEEVPAAVIHSISNLIITVY